MSLPENLLGSHDYSTFQLSILSPFGMRQSAYHHCIFISDVVLNTLFLILLEVVFKDNRYEIS